MIVEIPDDNSIIKWKMNDKDDWKSAEILDLINAYEKRSNEQIAWEQGYEAGLAQGKQDRPQGVWTTDEKGYFYCDKCGKYPHDQYSMTNFCPTCGADMRGDNK